MATDPHTYEIRRRTRQATVALTGREDGLRAYRSHLKGPDSEAIVEILSLWCGALDLLGDKPYETHWEWEMKALRRRNAERRAADAA